MPRTKAVCVRNPVYALASSDGVDAELQLYGDIYEQRPVDWYGDPVDGEFILLNDFLADLEKIAGCKTLTIHLSSYGGDAGVSNLIHNKLRELSRGGMQLTCIVDAVAMSGGSIIMCACDTVKVNPSSLIMIHKCWCFLFGGYNADELRSQAKEQDAWDKMQVECYKRKTGLSETVLLHMMSDTTHMTGREAVEKGFADALLEDAAPASIAASADGRFLYVNGRKMHLGQFAPDTIPTVTPEASAPDEANTQQPGDPGEGGNHMTIEELRAQYPDEIAQVEAAARAAADNTEAANAAAQAERERIQGIDDIASLLDAETVRAAKYGEQRPNAKDLLYEAAQKAAKQGKKFLSDMEADAKDSKTGEVNPAPAGEEGAPEPDTPKGKMEQARAQIKALFGKEE